MAEFPILFTSGRPMVGDYGCDAGFAGVCPLPGLSVGMARRWVERQRLVDPGARLVRLQWRGWEPVS